MNRTEKTAAYIREEERYKNIEKKEDKILLLLSVSRLVLFIGGITFTILGYIKNSMEGTISLVFFIALFIVVLKLFIRHTKYKNYIANLAVINRNEAAALSGDLSAFNTGKDYIDIHHDFSHDVDLFGKSSLFHYINRTITGYGRNILAAWLSDPYSLSAEFDERQNVIRELADKKEWRQGFMASGMSVPLDEKSIAGLTGWLNAMNKSSSSLIRRILIILLPAVACLTFILAAAGVISFYFFTLFFLLNLFYISIGLKSSNRIHDAVSRQHGYLSSFLDLLYSFSNESFSAPSLNKIKESFLGNNISATIAVKSLGDVIGAFDSRINMFAGVVLNGLLLWDYQCIHRLEKWKKRYRDAFPLWLDMTGTIDAYISLANYAGNNDDFVYPVISGTEELFSARDLGHQLIAEEKRVCNDFNIRKKGEMCIVTGANMAGKSTFLRTVAINYIMAMAGAPVCASEMSFIPVKLFTSMRTTDSLSDNESYFYAELKRLKTLLNKVMNGEQVFIILDEILKGTNSEDKSSGSKLFMKKMVSYGGTGLIATHDISLGTLEDELPGKIVNKCFEIEIDGQAIHFDYKLHDGITKKMNAVFLMRQMGIL
ncbi:MAG TPA: hypothetical protein VJ963_14920 [Bacteroidales bacterium]|nr:hypothetical protein [Bacteroidales bacterium]